MDNGEDLHAHTEVVDKLLGAVDGQGVHEAHTAAVHEIAEEGHSQQHGEDTGDDHGGYHHVVDQSLNAAQSFGCGLGILDRPAAVPQP